MPAYPGDVQEDEATGDESVRTSSSRTVTEVDSEDNNIRTDDTYIDDAEDNDDLYDGEIENLVEEEVEEENEREEVEEENETTESINLETDEDGKSLLGNTVDPSINNPYPGVNCFSLFPFTDGSPCKECTRMVTNTFYIWGKNNRRGSKKVCEEHAQSFEKTLEQRGFVKKDVSEEVKSKVAQKTGAILHSDTGDLDAAETIIGMKSNDQKKPQSFVKIGTDMNADSNRLNMTCRRCGKPAVEVWQDQNNITDFYILWAPCSKFIFPPPEDEDSKNEIKMPHFDVTEDERAELLERLYSIQKGRKKAAKKDWYGIK